MLGYMGTDLGTIVVVEDDTNIADLVDMYLRREGFRVIQAGTGEAGLAAIERERPRMAILDVGLPGVIDGLEVCRRIRANRSLPVLMLTARDGEVDRVLGLEMGADDYVTKPFSPRELVARVKAILRRSDGGPRSAVKCSWPGGSRWTLCGGRPGSTGKSCSSRQRSSSCCSSSPSGRGGPCPASSCSTVSGGQGWYGDDRTVDAHVRQLRKKLGDALPLSTVWGMGYRLG